MPQYFVYPRMSALDFVAFRVGGPGLGNLLFPWARAVVLAEQYDLIFIDPTWPQLKFGPYLRRERDKRSYDGIFNRSAGAVGGIEKAAILMTSRMISENEIGGLVSGAIDSRGFKRVVVRCEGLGGFFSPLQEHRELIFKRFLSICRERDLAIGQGEHSKAIGVHIRLGDFKGSRRETPLAWYRDVILRLRMDLACGDLICLVFSDGTDKELSDVLALPNIRRVCSRSAVADLIAMSRSRVLISGGHSSFSHWAQFFGKVPHILPEEERALRIDDACVLPTGSRSPLGCIDNEFVQLCRDSIARTAPPLP